MTFAFQRIARLNCAMSENISCEGWHTHYVVTLQTSLVTMLAGMHEFRSPCNRAMQHLSISMEHLESRFASAEILPVEVGTTLDRLPQDRLDLLGEPDLR